MGGHADTSNNLQDKVRRLFQSSEDVGGHADKWVAKTELVQTIVFQSSEDVGGHADKLFWQVFRYYVLSFNHPKMWGDMPTLVRPDRSGELAMFQSSEDVGGHAD